MIRSIVSSALVFTAALSLAACAGPTAASGSAPAVTTTAGVATSLDGASYDVTLTFPGEAPIRDTLRFAGGRFESSACTPLGFPRWSEYRASGDHGALAFEVTAHHPAGTTMEWKGSAVAGGVEGTATRTMNGVRAVGRFQGTAH